MDLDSFDTQEIALALSRALEGSPTPHEAIPKPEQRNLFVVLKGSDGSLVDPVRLGERLVRELNRVGFDLVRQR